MRNTSLEYTASKTHFCTAVVNPSSLFCQHVCIYWGEIPFAVLEVNVNVLPSALSQCKCINLIVLGVVARSFSVPDSAGAQSLVL